jgi:hypothetical protein
MPMERIDRSIPGANLALIALALFPSRLNRCPPLAHWRSPVAAATGPSPRIDSRCTLLTSADQNMIDLRNLPELWYRRTQGSALSNGPIGLGAVLAIFVPATDESESHVVRVSDDGRIFLFFIRPVRAAELNKKGLDRVRRFRPYAQGKVI